VWDERAFFNGYSHTKTVSEVAHRKTERLADAAAQRREGSYERVLGGRPAETRLARLGDRVRGVLRGSVPGRRWRMECPYCASDHTARSWNMAVLKTDIHVSNADSNAHGSGDATTAADFPEDEDRENPTLEASGGWSA